MSWSPLGRPIRVGAFEHDPDAFACFRRLPVQRCKKPGAEMEIISMVMKLLDWQWEVVDTEKEFNVLNNFGDVQPDGNITGILGLLANDKIDMSGLSMRITPSRMKHAHFTFPIRYFQQVYIVRRPPENDFRNFIFAPFTTQMWILLLATIMAVSTVRFVCALFWEGRAGTKFNIYTSNVLETFGIMIKQRITDPTAISTMILEGILILTMMMIAQYYQTSMNSRLTAPPSAKIPFYHQDQLIELLLKRETYLTYYFNVDLEGTSEKNEKDLKRALLHNPIIVRSKEPELVNEIKLISSNFIRIFLFRAGGVFFSSYDIEFLPNTVSTWDKREELTVIRDSEGIISYVAFGFSVSNRKLCQMFNKSLIKILPGVPTITLGPGYGTKKQREDTAVQVKKTTLSLKKHLEQLFYMYLVGLGVSSVAFVIEHVFYRLMFLRKQGEYQVNRRESNEQTNSTFTPLPYN